MFLSADKSQFVIEIICGGVTPPHHPHEVLEEPKALPTVAMVDIGTSTGAAFENSVRTFNAAIANTVTRSRSSHPRSEAIQNYPAY